MKIFFEIVRKEFIHIARDYRTLLVLIGMPIAQLIIFGFAIRTEIRDADIGIYDKSRDTETQKIIDKIKGSGYFNIRADIQSPDDIEPAFKSGKVKQVVVFEPGFGRKLRKEGYADMQLLNDASSPNEATLLSSYMQAVVYSYNREAMNMPEGNNRTINQEIKMLFNPEMKSVFMFVPGLIVLILTLVSAMMTSIAITREKEMGSMEILLVSPLKPQLIIIGKVIPYIAIALVNLATILLLSITIFKVPFAGSIPLFLLLSFVFIITVLLLGILISTIAKTQQIALMISMVGLLMPTILLSGFIYPIENMPVALQVFSNIIPARWFLVIVKSIMLKGLGIESLVKETLVILGMIVFLTLVSVKKFKIRLD